MDKECKELFMILEYSGASHCIRALSGWDENDELFSVYPEQVKEIIILDKNGMEKKRK